MAQRRHVGRPTTAAKEGEKATLGIRASATLKTRLNDAATSNARSLSQEAELRLEQSFRDDEQLPAALKRIYGAQLAGLLLLLGEVLRDVGPRAGLDATLTLAGRDEWMTLPYPYQMARDAISSVMTALQPEGKAAIPAQFLRQMGDDEFDVDVEDAARHFGAAAPIPILDILADPKHSYSSKRLNDLANELRPLLGTTVDRISSNLSRVWEKVLARDENDDFENDDGDPDEDDPPIDGSPLK